MAIEYSQSLEGVDIINIDNNLHLNPPTQSDEAWKRVLDRWFQPFLKCFWPHISDQIDWNKAIEELSPEMQPFTTSSLVGKQIVDKVYQVHTRDAHSYMVLVHIEVQGNSEAHFARRLFEYCYKLYEHYQLPVLPLVVLSDDNKTWRPDPFEISVFGHVTIRYDFLSVKLLDWKGQEERLLVSLNPFENLIAIYLEARRTKNHPNTRLKAKIAIFDSLTNQGWEQDDIISFYTFLDGVMRLPKALELQYHNHVIKTEREKNMSYISSAEQIGIEKGMQQGMQAGIHQEKHAIAQNMIQQGSDDAFIILVTGLPASEVKKLRKSYLS